MPADEPHEAPNTESGDPLRDAAHDAPPAAELPPLAPFHTPSRAERPLPRGCHPLVFGVVMATLQMAALWFFMPSCFGRPG
ncbi:MAG TPA: hypothetical protein VGD56_15905 [Gemmatirosa sp.]